MKFLDKIQAEINTFEIPVPYNVNSPHGDFVVKIGDRVKVTDDRRGVEAYFRITKINEKGFEVETI